MEKKTYTQEFKLGAARMVVDERKKAVVVCQDLGVSAASLARWIHDYKKSGSHAFPGKGRLTPEDEKVRNLEKEVRLLKMERDLLKKTMGLFIGRESRNSQQ